MSVITTTRPAYDVDSEEVELEQDKERKSRWRLTVSSDMAIKPMALVGAGMFDL